MYVSLDRIADALAGHSSPSGELAILMGAGPSVAVPSSHILPWWAKRLDLAVHRAQHRSGGTAQHASRGGHRRVGSTEGKARAGGTAWGAVIGKQRTSRVR